MKILFKNKRKSSDKTESHWKDTGAIRIASVILNIQREWAEWMYRKTEKLSPKKMKLLFISFFLLQGSACVCLITGVIPSWPSAWGREKTTAIKPKSITENPMEQLKTDSTAGKNR